MAEIVWAAAASHTGAMMREPKGDPESLARAERVFAAFDQLAASLRAAKPDVLVIVANDHFLTFSYANLPTFAVGTGDRFEGHGEFGVPKRDYVGNATLGRAVHEGLIAAGFDMAGARDMPLDHSYSCPLQLLLKGWDVPLLPVFVNCTVPPLPAFTRCHDLGTALGDVLRAQTSCERVAIFGTGGISHWVGTPRTGIINPEFDNAFLDKWTEGRIDELLTLDSDEVIETAGNGAAEIRNWFLAAAAARSKGAKRLAYEPVQAWVTGIGVTELIL